MQHNEYKKLIQLALYSELNDDEQKELENHLTSCENCRKEMEQQKTLLKIISDREKKEIDDGLLHDARSQLRGALRMERGKRSFDLKTRNPAKLKKSKKNETVRSPKIENVI